MPVAIKRLQAGEEDVLANPAEGVFDHEVSPRLAREFLADPRHHIVVAIDDGRVVGFVSAVHYVHPDKRAELWVNEVAVAPSHQGRGLGKSLMNAMLAVARQYGCRAAWVLTERANEKAMRLYSSLGGAEMDTVMFNFNLAGKTSDAE